MKGRLTLAEAATTHPDGTTSILRSGITAAWGKLPVGLQGALVARIEGELPDSGGHRFDLRCMDADGADVMPQIQGGFEIPQGGGAMNFVLQFGMQFQKHGRYTFVLRCDNITLDTWPVNVTEVPPPHERGAK